MLFFFFKQKTAYELRISDWSSDVCSSNLLAPREAGYRAVLGQSYLTDGRFTSARQAFTDALALDSNNGKVALSLALAQTAEGDWTAARATLDDHAGVIPATDRGLALALAGDPDRKSTRLNSSH